MQGWSVLPGMGLADECCEAPALRLRLLTSVAWLAASLE